MSVRAELWSSKGRLVMSQVYCGDKEWIKEQIATQNELVFLRPCGGEE